MGENVKGQQTNKLVLEPCQRMAKIIVRVLSNLYSINLGENKTLIEVDTTKIQNNGKCGNIESSIIKFYIYQKGSSIPFFQKERIK